MVFVGLGSENGLRRSRKTRSFLPPWPCLVLVAAQPQSNSVVIATHHRSGPDSIHYNKKCLLQRKKIVVITSKSFMQNAAIKFDVICLC